MVAKPTEHQTMAIATIPLYHSNTRQAQTTTLSVHPTKWKLTRETAAALAYHVRGSCFDDGGSGEQVRLHPRCHQCRLKIGSSRRTTHTCSWKPLGCVRKPWLGFWEGFSVWSDALASADRDFKVASSLVRSSRLVKRYRPWTW